MSEPVPNPIEPAALARQVRIVLVGTQHPGNIGAAARAIKTMGLSRLVLVAPEKPLDDDAYRRSAGAEDVLEQAPVYATLAEAVTIDGDGRVGTPDLRSYHLPTMADVPLTQVHFARTSDPLGPAGAKSMSESPFNPVAAALANALRDATGVRFTELPFTRDRVWHTLHHGHPADQ